MSDSVQAFYDQLAEHYTLIYADWRDAVGRHGEILDGFIRAQGYTPPLTVLDCTCGIGTQVIGLALRGYACTGTDLSPAAIEQALRNAAAFGADVQFAAADVRRLADEVAGEFDLVVSFDNALPHLLSDDDQRAAARNLHVKVKPGGALIASIRDYDRAVQDRPRAAEPRVFDSPGERRIVFQVWDWAEDGRTYRLQHFIVRGDGTAWQTLCHTTVYRALLREELSGFLHEAGFCDIRWHMPEESGYYQPIVMARKK